MGDEGGFRVELVSSIVIALVTSLLLTTSIGHVIVKPLLLDGSLISSGRFAFIYEGYDTVRDDDAVSVVGIGSSIMLSAMNGTCMELESEVENTQFYNFAMSGGKPYSEMVQIPALIDAKPEVVMVEVGPNSLYGWNPLNVHESISDYHEFRFQLMSMGMPSTSMGGWYDNLDENDKQYFDMDLLGKEEAWSEYSRDAIEEYLIREIDEISSANLKDNGYGFVPPVNSNEWDDYLSTPNYHISRYEGKSLEYIREDLDKRMPSKALQGVYNPESNGTQNHRALDYTIHELLNHSIDVVLVGIPHHPWVNDYLQPGQLDGMNTTYDRYSMLDGVTSLQMYWEEWPSDAFDNRNHIDGDGREIFCKRVTPIIDAVLTGVNPNEVVIDSSVYHLSSDQMMPSSACLDPDSNNLFVGSNDIIEIQAEDFSHCITGTGEASNIGWEIDSTMPNYTGSGYVIAIPDEKVKVGDATNGPRIGYNITFNQSGTYHVWVRMSAPNGASDSIHVGLNGLPVTFGANGLGIWDSTVGDEWMWKDSMGERITIEVPNAGEHQFYIWMREDGVRVDSIILTTDSEFYPDAS